VGHVTRVGEAPLLCMASGAGEDMNKCNTQKRQQYGQEEYLPVCLPAALTVCSSGCVSEQWQPHPAIGPHTEAPTYAWAGIWPDTTGTHTIVRCGYAMLKKKGHTQHPPAPPLRPGWQRLS
jgi:hypothetical protein